MWARIRLHIDWTDLLYGSAACLRRGDPQRLQDRLESLWSPEGDALAAFSVRSGFDLLLRALDLPPKSEIMFSALNIKGMIKIARGHGLVPVPVDLDLERMGPKPEALEQALTPETRAIVVAHLFGAHLDLEAVAAFAKRHDLLLIEDCAQAFEGPEFTGHPEADVAMFSFGPLKTATALGGALMRVKDRDLLARMRRLQSEYPVQKRGDYAKRLAKFAVLKLVLTRPVYGLLMRYLEWRRIDYDTAVGDAVREVASLGTEKKLRKRPSAAMLSVLERRLRRWQARSLQERSRTGESLREALEGFVPCPGIRNERHSYWVFPVLVDDPKEAMLALRRAGFDGTNLPRSEAVAAPEGRPHLAPTTASDVLDRMVVLPCYPDLPRPELLREAEVIRRLSEKSAKARTSEAAA